MATASTLNSVSRIVPDAAYVEDPYNGYYPNPEIRMSVYERNATHSLSISKGNTTIITMQMTHVYPTGNNWAITVTMSDAQRATLISSMSDVASFTATYTLTTYLNGSAIGTSTAQALVELHYSFPSYTSITYRDINPSTIALTGDNQKIIQGASDLEFTVTGATPGRSTTLKEYYVTAWSTTGNVTTFPTSEVPSGVLLYGNVNLGLSESANARFDVGVRDARNTSKETSLSIPIIVLTPPRITAYDIKRNASDSTRLDFSFSGTCDTLTQSNISASFKYKLKTDSTYSAAISLSGLTITAGAFTCSTTYSGVTFLEDKNYDIQLIVTDGINTDTINLTILHATIHVAFREEAIGLGTVPHGIKRVEIAQDWSLVATPQTSTPTATKTSGVGTVTRVQCDMFGCLVQLTVLVDFSNVAVTAGTNLWEGTITGVPYPTTIASGAAYAYNSALIGRLLNSGTLRVRVVGDDIAAQSPQSTSIVLTYLTNG